LKFAQDVMAFQSWGSLNFGNFEIFNLGVLGWNDIWMQPPWLITENIIRRKVVASLKFGSWWVLWVHVCPWLVRAPKVLQLALTNLLFDLCMSVWIIDPLVTCLSPHPESPTCPSTPEMLRVRECTLIPSSVVFTFRLAFESFKECEGATRLFTCGINKFNHKNRLKFWSPSNKCVL
jgi:hypothetical protein